MKYLFIFLVSLNVFYSALAYAADCTTVKGTTVTVSATCNNGLTIKKNGSHVTINSGVTVKDDEQAILTTTTSTNTTIINNGTIKATDNKYGIYNQGIITTIDNSGTITADKRTIENISGSTITTITNSGTISATSGSGAIRNEGGSTIGSIINSGTISSTAPNAIRNTGGSTITTLTNSGTISNSITNNANDEITTLTNSGTISSTTKDTIINRGTIGTLTNTGTINASGAGDFDLSMGTNGTITTFNNSQGRSTSDPVTFENSLPTNYNVIVNSTSDYGQIEFSSVSGQTIFGVDSSSTLVGDTTYSSVVSGLTSGDIASGTSGTFVSGSARRDWTLENSSGNTWDLVVAADKNITPDTNSSVVTSTKPNVIAGINDLRSVIEVNFANMNTYDCDSFDKKDACLSLGGRYATINNPKTATNGLVLVAGYRFTNHLRVAGFYHHNLSHKTPASFKLRDKTPLVGALVVWNEKSNKLGFQIKVGNAYQRKSAELIRAVVGSSEEGKGYTDIEAQSYVAEFQYGYKTSDNVILKPYFAYLLASVEQKGFTEIGLSSPLTFNSIKDSSVTVVGGMQFNIGLFSDLFLRGSLGVEHDLIHNVDRLEPSGINGLSAVSLDNNFNQTRPIVTFGFDNNLSPSKKISATFQYQELSYESKEETNFYIYYTIGL